MVAVHQARGAGAPAAAGPSSYAQLRQLDATLTPSPSPSTTSPPPTQQHIDVRFVDGPVQLHSIVFTNYYSATVTVLYSSTAGAKASTVAAASRSERLDDGAGTQSAAAAPDGWQVLVPMYQLMVDPHSEDDAQAHHELSASSFLSFERVYSLRICLSQERAYCYGPLA
jgi:hypothetical protein